MATLAELRALARAATTSGSPACRRKLDDYWETFDPLFDWTPTEKIFRAPAFLRREVVPRRDAVLAIAQEIEELNNANLAAQRAEVARGTRRSATTCAGCSGRRVLLGLAVALIVVFRLRVLERRSDEQRRSRGRRAADAPAVAAAGRDAGGRAQEPVARAARSRRAGAHRAADGARPDRARSRPPATRGSARRSPNASSSSTSMFRTVRDLALGLRPSMLDDFGLQPALEWHVRDFTRRYGVDVELDVDGDFDALPDRYRTCVYRAVQEALTNCVRHAQARSDQGRASRGTHDHLRRVGHRRRRRTRSGAAPRRPGPARHRGARQGAARRR